MTNLPVQRRSTHPRQHTKPIAEKIMSTVLILYFFLGPHRAMANAVAEGLVRMLTLPSPSWSRGNRAEIPQGRSGHADSPTNLSWIW
jgi:hypothetical protein